MKRNAFYVIAYPKGIILLAVLLIFCLCSLDKASATQAISFRDDLNRKIELKRPSVRIVSLSESHTENLVAIRAVGQLVGVNFTADEKWVFKRITRISRTPSVRQIAGLYPDLVLLDREDVKKDSDLVKELEKLGISAVVLNRPKLSGLGSYFDRLGKLTGRSREAAQALVMLDKSLYKAAVRSNNKTKLKVFVIAGADFSTCAEDSWGAKLLAASGAVSLIDKNEQRINGYPWFIFFGPQKLAAVGKNVEMIITLKNNRRGIPFISRDDILKDPRFINIPAVKNGRVWEMDESDLMMPSLVRLDATLFKCRQLLDYKYNTKRD